MDDLERRVNEIGSDLDEARNAGDDEWRELRDSLEDSLKDAEDLAEEFGSEIGLN